MKLVNSDYNQIDLYGIYSVNQNSCLSQIEGMVFFSYIVKTRCKYNDKKRKIFVLA